MRRFIVIAFIALEILSASNKPLFAEKRKTLEELLIDKGTITKEEAASVQETKLAKWVERLTFAGDLRLRHESFIRDDPNPDRHRQRFRLRFGSELKIDDSLVGIRLASGGGDQNSTNQSFDNFFNQKQIWIDRAYLRWEAVPWLALTGGRMPNPFFLVYTSDIVWDDDINPEGLAENFTFKLTDTVVLFINAGQFVLDEDATDNNDQWLFAEQAGIQVGLNKETTVTLAGAFYNFKNATEGNFGITTAGGQQDGNTRADPTRTAAGTYTNPTLVNHYRVFDITAQFAIKIADLPLALQGDYVKNLADTTTDKDIGYQAGLILGKASGTQTWEAAYFYKLVETDATIADLSDSDFGNGGINRKGHIVWIAYNPTKALQVKTKYFMTEVEDETLPPGEDDINRLQVDLVMKF